MLTPETNLILTAMLTRPQWGKLEASETVDHRIMVWLPGAKTYDQPDGIGDSLAEALEDAAHKVSQKVRR